MPHALKNIPISDIKPAKFNPPSRTKNIRWLQQSIETHGLMYPVLLDEDQNLIDGHRRLAACKALGWETIPSIALKGDQQTLYGEIATNFRKLSGNELLHVYLSAPMAISSKLRDRMDKMKEVLGDKLVQRMAKLGLSWRTFRTALQVANYVERHGNDDFIRRTTQWLIKHGALSGITRAMSSEVPAAIVMRAIQKNQPLRTKYSVGT